MQHTARIPCNGHAGSILPVSPAMAMQAALTTPIWRISSLSSISPVVDAAAEAPPAAATACHRSARAAIAAAGANILSPPLPPLNLVHVSDDKCLVDGK